MPAPQIIGKYPKTRHRVMAALGHLLIIPSALLALGAGAFVVPLVWWVVARRASPLVDYHARFALNAAITFSLISASFQGLGLLRPQNAFPLTVFLGLVAFGWLCMVLRRSLRAWRGQDLRQPRFSWVG